MTEQLDGPAMASGSEEMGTARDDSRPTDGRATSPGMAVTIAYEEAGAGEPTVVLLHGWGFGDPSHLAPQFHHLAAHHRVLKLDLPGHGRSDRPPQGFTFADGAAAVVALLDGLGVGSAVVCGHSLGGRLAVELAAAHPSRVAGVVLLDPVVLFPEPVRQQSLAGFLPALATEHWLPATEAYFSRLLSPDDPPDLRTRVLTDLGGISPEVAAPLLRQGMESDGSDALERVRCPLLMVSAGAPVNIDRLRELQPNVWTGHVVGSGHWMTIAVPDQVNAMVDRFLEAIATAPPLMHASASS